MYIMAQMFFFLGVLSTAVVTGVEEKLVVGGQLAQRKAVLTRYQSIHRTVLRLEQALDKEMGCVRSIILERSSRDLGIVLVAMESVPVFTPFSRRYTPKIRKMKTLLLSHLDKVFVEAVVPSNLFDTDKHDLDVNLLSPILRSYVTMEEEVHRSL